MPRKPPAPVRPLDHAALERLALRYVERFATTRARLADYLRRKVRERGWEGAAADPVVIADRLAGLGYIDDRSYGVARARALSRRGLGARRVVQALRHAGVVGDDAEAIAPQIEDRALETALAFARRRRLGPWSGAIADRALREKQVGSMVRAGHSVTLARTIVAMPPGSDPDLLSESLATL